MYTWQVYSLECSHTQINFFVFDYGWVSWVLLSSIKLFILLIYYDLSSYWISTLSRCVQLVIIRIMFNAACIIHLQMNVFIVLRLPILIMICVCIHHRIMIIWVLLIPPLLQSLMRLLDSHLITVEIGLFKGHMIHIFNVVGILWHNLKHFNNLNYISDL